MSNMDVTGFSEATIIAISSATGMAGRGILRLSGSEAISLTLKLVGNWADQEALTNSPGGTWLDTRVILQDPITCPCRLMVFRTPHSYTGEDLVEWHLPGSPVLLKMVLDRLLALGARTAQPGEFTARAFFNGKLDLSQAEAVNEVISARSDAQLRAAQRLLGGQLHHRCRQIRDRLLELLSLVEASIDFSDQDIELIPLGELHQKLEILADEVQKLLGQSTSWDQLHHLPQVVIAGRPNAGKSSLINALTGLDRSIVSHLAGTTRDLLTVPLPLSHGECLLIDTAGCETMDASTGSFVSREMQRLARWAIAGCDVLVWVFDAADKAFADKELILEARNHPQRLFVANKVDLLNPCELAEIAASTPAPILPVSALKGIGLEDLRRQIEIQLHSPLSDVAQGAIALTSRQRQSLEQAHQSLVTLTQEKSENSWEILALHLREVLEFLENLTGQAVSEEILDTIFSRFCIGK